MIFRRLLPARESEDFPAEKAVAAENLGWLLWSRANFNFAAVTEPVLGTSLSVSAWQVCW
jgi:hypothetical protein